MRTSVVGIPLFLVLLVSGCGSPSSGDAVAPRDAPASTPAAATQLTVAVDDGAGRTNSSTLTCAPTGGTLGTAAQACAKLATPAGQKAMQPVSKDLVCTQIFGGAQTATVTGTLNGTSVSASFSRKNGCEISRWKTLEGLLPAVAAAGPQ